MGGSKDGKMGYDEIVNIALPANKITKTDTPKVIAGNGIREIPKNQALVISVRWLRILIAVTIAIFC